MKLNKFDITDRIPRLFVCSVVVIVAIAAQPAVAEEYVSEDWQFTVNPYFWALQASGDATVKGVDAEVDLEWSDIWDALNIGFMVEMEARKGRWGMFLHPFYAQLEWDESLVDATLDLFFTSFGVGYGLGRWNLSSGTGATGPKLVADIYAGARYTYMKLDVDVSISRPGPLPDLNQSADGDEDWFDPIVGLRTLWYLTPKWSISAAGDIGGFGVSSDFTWMATAVTGYRFNMWGGDNNASVYAGYRAVSWDYENGSGNNKFAWDATLHGPVLGVGFRF